MFLFLLCCIFQVKEEYPLKQGLKLDVKYDETLNYPEC